MFIKINTIGVTLHLVGWLIAGVAPAGQTAEFYVATNGNDRWSGRLAAPNRMKSDGPFASLQRARDAIRSRRSSGTTDESQTVYVRSGTYEIRQTLKFEAQDGGSPAAPVTYCAYKDDKPILVGGGTITGFVPHKGNILKADVGAQGFKGIYFRQLIFDGHRQQLARYPNFDPRNPHGGGWAYADGESIPLYTDSPEEDTRSFTIKQKDIRTWAHPKEVQVFVFARYNWWNDICDLDSIDAATRRVRLAEGASYAVRLHDRFYFQNALEELDAPGEWYLDKRTSTLYFWPPSALKGKAVIAPTTRTILELGKGTANVTVRGFIVQCAEGTAITLNETTNCLIAANTIRNVGDYEGCGVAVNGGVRNGVVGNDVFDTGSHGIRLSGGDRIKLVSAENSAVNNYIHHVGVIYKHGVGIDLSGVGNRASHNLIHDGPRMGLMFSGNNLVIEYNHIRHMSLETEDTGAIYTGGRDWISSRGSVIRYNYIHDILGYGHDEKGLWHSPFFAWGVYLDDNTGGVDVIGNIIVRCSRAGLHLHNGRDNHIENNIIVNNGEQQVQYGGWTKDDRRWKAHQPTMIAGYEAVVSELAWRNMRNMSLHPTNAILPNGTIMTGNEFIRNIIYYHSPKAQYLWCENVPFDHNVIDSNLIWHFDQTVVSEQNGPGMMRSKMDWTKWQVLGLDHQSLIADPLFVDAAKDDYRLRRKSPAYDLGFKAIPAGRIGPYRDPLRASWPIREAEGVREQPITKLALRAGQYANRRN